MSIAIATLGMFIPAVGSGSGIRGGSSGPVMITEERKRPVIQVLNVRSENILSKNLIEITSIITGD
jgi:hypothetical protein